MSLGTRRAVGGLAVAVVVLIAGVLGVWSVLRDRGVVPPLVGERCVATANQNSVVLDLDQAHYASIIVGLSVRRGLAPRAASIAMATVFQETGIRNLDYGDRDSVGLFQQRPSQGWGTPEELIDPYYATGKFYDALVRVPGWESGDITEVAQRVQRSGYPDAYRPHETNARVLASTLTGRSPGGFTCFDRSGTAGDAGGLATSIRRTFGQVTPRVEGNTLAVTAKSAALAWAYASHAVANASRFGVTTVRVSGQEWRAGGADLPAWTETGVGSERRVVVTLR